MGMLWGHNGDPMGTLWRTLWGPYRHTVGTLRGHYGAIIGSQCPDLISPSPQLPNFLQKIPDYGLYSHDVEFINHHLRLHTRGRVLYQLAVSLCRAAVWGYFAGVRLEVLALTRHPELGCIRARWRLVGVPFHLCLLRFYRRDKRDLLRSAHTLSPLSPPCHLCVPIGTAEPVGTVLPLSLLSPLSPFVSIVTSVSPFVTPVVPLCPHRPHLSPLSPLSPFVPTVTCVSPLSPLSPLSPFVTIVPIVISVSPLSPFVTTIPHIPMSPLPP
ncbi:uncharacterized protein C6orf136 homolog, partial [Meleagris gallopavo]